MPEGEIRWERCFNSYYIAEFHGVEFRVERVNVCLDEDRPRWVFAAYEGLERILERTEIGSEKTRAPYALKRATELARKAIPVLFA